MIFKWFVQKINVNTQIFVFSAVLFYLLFFFLLLGVYAYKWLYGIFALVKMGMI